MNREQFKGPLFVVGMPRSGTKLLRTLLNMHPAVYIPEVETHFLSQWVEHWGSYGDLSDFRQFSKFYDSVKSLPYFTYTSEEQTVITVREWYDSCDDYTAAAVFAALVAHDAGYVGGIWGDKTPSYLSHMELLKEVFPSARFIHIVRDVRDYCLSSKQAWGKSMLRAAQLWSDRVTDALRAGESLDDDCLVMRYEDLVVEPETQLRIACDFLGIAFDPVMTSPDRSAENLGDARGIQGILPGNTEKYKTRMDTMTQTRIEAVSGVCLKKLGYPVAYNGPSERISTMRLGACKVYDGVSLLRFEIRNRGLLDALKLRWKLYAVSGNRLRS